MSNKTNEKRALINKMDKELIAMYTSIEDKISNYILPNIAFHIPYFIDHGKGHSERIINNIYKIINQNKNINLSELDYFTLLCSAYLHDIGYCIQEKDGKSLSDKEIQDTHNELSEYYILKNYKAIGFNTHNIAAYVGEICKYHRRKMDFENNLEDDKPISGYLVHPKLVCSIFRLCDALDLDNRRAPEFMTSYVTNLPRENQKYWEVCQIIDGYYIKDNKIIVSAKIKNKNQNELIKDKLIELSDELLSIKEVLLLNEIKIIDVVGHIHIKNKKEIIDGKKLWQARSADIMKNEMFKKAMKESANYRKDNINIKEDSFDEMG